MGIQGLRKFVNSTGCCRTIPAPPPADDATTPREPPSLVDHVLFDMNGLIHSCYNPREHLNGGDTVRAVLERLTSILREIVAPLMTLTLVIDGPPPVAKLHEQRLRRRKLRHMDVANASGFSDLAITTGSPFLVELEAVLQRFLVAAKTEGWLRVRRAAVVGSTVIGEGEHKIARALHLIATDKEIFRHDASVVLVGNDIDLTLTCLGATSFLNLGVLSPGSLQFVDVAHLLREWTTGKDGIASKRGFVKGGNDLAAARLDFVFLFLLNGGDHYLGLGEDAATALWARYEQLKRSKGGKMFRVFNPAGSQLCVPNFAELIGCDFSTPLPEDAEDDDEAGGHGDTALDDELAGGGVGGKAGQPKKKKTAPPLSNRAKEAMDLARSLLDNALWAFEATVHGSVAEYGYVPPDTSGVVLQGLRDAVLRLPNAYVGLGKTKASGAKSGSVTGRLAHLPPLLSFAAVMPTVDHLPKAFQAAAAHYPVLATALNTANDPAAVVKAVSSLWSRVRQEALTPMELALTVMGPPVDVALPSADAGRSTRTVAERGIAATWESPFDYRNLPRPFDTGEALVFRDPLQRRAKTHLWKPLRDAAAAEEAESGGLKTSHNGKVDRRGLNRRNVGRRDRSAENDRQLRQDVRRAFAR